MRALDGRAVQHQSVQVAKRPALLVQRVEGKLLVAGPGNVEPAEVRGRQRVITSAFQDDFARLANDGELEF